MTAETLYSEYYVQSLPELGAITNSKMLRPPEEYLRTTLDGVTSLEYENLALSKDFLLDVDGVMVPVEVFEYLAAKHGVDVPVYRARNP